MASDRFVSRGGEKLQAALEKFQIRPDNSICLDIGSSTGGFVDCLLQNNASKIYSVDTAYGELAWKLRNDPRVVVMERTNALHLEKLPSSVIARSPKDDEAILNPEKIASESSILRNDTVKVDLITIDAGWTKLELVLPVVKKFLKEDGSIIALLKPHYETEKKNLRKGVVPSDKVEEIKDQVINNIKELGFEIVNQMESPILGGGGNTEYLLLLKQLL